MIFREYNWNHPEAIKIIKEYLLSQRSDLRNLASELRPYVSPSSEIPISTLCEHLKKPTTLALLNDTRGPEQEKIRDRRKRQASAMSQCDDATDPEMNRLLESETHSYISRQRDAYCASDMRRPLINRENCTSIGREFDALLPIVGEGLPLSETLDAVTFLVLDLIRRPKNVIQSFTKVKKLAPIPKKNMKKIVFSEN